MAIAPNVFWKTAIDFRNFDISVPKFDYENNNNRSIDFFDLGPVAIDDEITLLATPSSAQNNSFHGSGITRSGQNITGGLLEVFVDNRSGGFDGYINFSAFAATTLNPVIDSVSTADDMTFLRKMLAGDDLIILSGGEGGTSTNDYVFGAAGSDSIAGNSGNDTLFGDGGSDAISGGTGKDRLYGGGSGDEMGGGAGVDQMFGGRGNDALFGDAGGDTLTGGKGADFLFGGTGADVFAFRKGDGNDTVKDWENNVDRIRFDATANVNFSVNYSGADALVTVSNITILIENVANGSLQLSQDGNSFFLT